MALRAMTVRGAPAHIGPCRQQVAGTAVHRRRGQRPARRCNLAAVPDGGDRPPAPAEQLRGPDVAAAAAAQQPAGNPVEGAAAGQAEAEATQPPQAAAPAMPAAPPKLTWRRLLTQTASKLAVSLWPLLLVHLVCDALVFGLHRVSHRLTNEAAVRLLGGAGITRDALGNLWWLSVDPEVANFKTGYQLLTVAVFLLAFPLNVLLKGTASIYTVYICEGDVGAEVRRPWWQALGALRASAPLVGALRSRVAAVWRGVFFVELIVAAAVVPLQFASLAVVTLPLTLPLILDLQAAGTAAVLEGVRGLAAIKRSRALLRPLRWRLAVPFVGIVVALRLADAAKGYLLSNMPPRYYREIVEVPIAVVVLGTLASLLLTRLQDVLPYVAYKEAVAQEQQAEGGKQRQGEQGGGGGNGAAGAGGAAAPGAADA